MKLINPMTYIVLAKTSLLTYWVVPVNGNLLTDPPFTVHREDSRLVRLTLTLIKGACLPF